MIFVTATVVDPAGNRVHSDDELPFAQTAIPDATESVRPDFSTRDTRDRSHRTWEIGPPGAETVAGFKPQEFL